VREKIAFIAHPKTASQATGGVLKNLDFKIVGSHHSWQHCPEDWIVFATIRNPFDLMVSWYYQEMYKSGAEVNFDWWLWKRLQEPNHYMKQGLFFGLGICTDVLHFENLQEEFDQLMKKVGLPQTKIPRKNVSDKREGRHFIDYYNSESIDIMMEKYGSTIYNNGYTTLKI